ncbi:hypothetical protein [Bradyrhizobium canariense]|uniref:Uncharacterized protein n=1 Tax=Bradyrhizobium canariense TaxID=255045 RepID=A0A1H1M8H0_9BRAD|nr:hypothetical protein [Bradyrhizobium canariense]SDR82917.1 hypothetical protein SAMN05444158_0129 [Bradyrhizobium canariense]
MSVSFSGVSSTPSSGTPQSTSLTAKPAAQTNSAVQQFLEYANMTPAQRMFASMLNKLGLTQDQFNAMSPADQQKVEQKIQQMIKQQVQDSSDKRTGMITDISA